MTETYRDDLNLISCLRRAEVSAIVLDGFVASVKAVATSIAVPVSSTNLLCAFYRANDVTSITTPYNT